MQRTALRAAADAERWADVPDVLSWKARCSRCAERYVEESSWGFGVLKTFGENSKRQRLNTGEGFVTARAVTERTWQVADLGNPSTVVFAFEFDREAHAHGSNVTRRQKHGRTTACTRPAPREGWAPAGMFVEAGPTIARIFMRTTKTTRWL